LEDFHLELMLDIGLIFEVVGAFSIGLIESHRAIAGHPEALGRRHRLMDHPVRSRGAEYVGQDSSGDYRVCFDGSTHFDSVRICRQAAASRAISLPGRDPSKLFRRGHRHHPFGLCV